MQELQRIWPEYQKGTPSQRLKERIDWEGVCKAAEVEEELRRFLHRLGFFDGSPPRDR